MKYPAIFTTALTSLLLLTNTEILASESTDVAEEELARWFEIEVILFKHLSNDSQNQEVFHSRDLTRHKQNARDLLAPYLQPDIASLKQLLPGCEQNTTAMEYGVDLSKVNLPVPETDTDTDTDTQESSEEAGQNLEESTTQQTQDYSMSVTVLADEASSQNQSEYSAEQNQAEGESNQEIAKEVIYPYADKEIPSYTKYPTDGQKPICIIPTEVITKNLSGQQLASFNIDGFPIEKLSTTVNGTEQWRDDENGEITWASDQPYLISQDSLRLKSIANRIKRSRNYAPLLHLGWRQEGKTRREAKATRLYAGENLALNYHKALIKSQSKQNELELAAILTQRIEAQALIEKQLAETQLGSLTNQYLENGGVSDASIQATIDQEGSLTNAASSNQNDIEDTFGKAKDTESHLLNESELTIAEQLQQQAKQQKLDKLFVGFELLSQKEAQFSAQQESIDNTSNDSSNPVASLDEQEIKNIVSKLSSDINLVENQLLLNDDNKEEVVISAPVQPWFLDGIFKVHLDHYLFINSEFNLVQKASLDKAGKTANNKQAQNQQVISFRQDRRVITGEIHYFDHPNMGMVVQIRRFDPTKPAKDAVSQSKK